MPIAPLILLAFLSFSVFAEQDCPPICETAREEMEKMESKIHRLIEIRLANLDFLSRLAPGQRSKLIKAASNVRIAERRIFEAKQKKEELEDTRRRNNCGACKKD